METRTFGASFMITVLLAFGSNAFSQNPDPPPPGDIITEKKAKDEAAAKKAAENEKVNKKAIDEIDKKIKNLDRIKDADKIKALEAMKEYIQEHIKEDPTTVLDNAAKAAKKALATADKIGDAGSGAMVDDLKSDLAKKIFGILFEAKGTGRTTGHIANISVTNNSDFAVVIMPQTFYIPSDGQYQSYVGRIPGGITVPPNSTTDIPGSGYCTDVNTPPVPSGTSMPPVDDWIPVGEPQIPSESDDGVPVILINTVPVPTFTPGDIPVITSTPAFTPSNNPAGDIVITWPGTGTPVGGTLNPESNPRHFAQVMVDVLVRLEDAVVIIQEDVQYGTPFSSDSVREQDAILQHDLWRYSGAITGDPYEKKDFADNVYDQFSDKTGLLVASLPKERKDELDSGIDDFWNAFQATGVEAKVIRNDGATDAQVFPGLEKDKIKDDLKKQGGQAEGQGNPQTPGTDSPTPGATVREEEEEKAECICESMTFTVGTNFGGLPINSSNEAVYEFNANQSTPKKVVIEVDEDDFSQKMTIIVSDIKVTCNCEDAECEYYSGKPTADNKGKVTISDVKVTGADVPEDGKTISGNGISVDATSKSANYFITFKVKATCMLEDCGKDVCIRYISIEIKPRKK